MADNFGLKIGVKGEKEFLLSFGCLRIFIVLLIGEIRRKIGTILFESGEIY